MSVGPPPALELLRAEAVGSRVLRRALGTFATGVTVLTVGGREPHGMTANSFTSVSLRPPLVLVCVDQQAVMHERMTHGTFGVSVLAAGQEGVARHFADLARPLGAAQFAGIDHAPGPVTGAPLIEGAVAHFECELVSAVDAGDHTIFLGGLLTLGWTDVPGDGLVFARGRFGRMTRDR